MSDLTTTGTTTPLPYIPSKPLPELLAPAGSPDALEAALHAGADAVYLGGSAFNARMNAHNFDRPALEAAVKAAHTAGARVYLTLNTLVYDRERAAALDAAYEAAVCGVDGLIIADVGMAALIHRALPHLPLHASTQLSGHNYRVGEFLKPRGFSRYVTARETSLEDLRTAVDKSGLEVEVFIHGALCVSHSGQCLFSSVVGGRSGNRGECAQPCRLPYTACHACPSSSKPEKPSDRHAANQQARDRMGGHVGGHASGAYPLSLKDLSLARHLPALIDMGVASLKIEGRMKSPAYVGGVTAIWRRLLDERRGATDEEMAALSDLFSRGGFTDGYLIGHVTHDMMGVRSDEDKSRTRETEKKPPNGAPAAALPTQMKVTVCEGAPMTLTATAPLYRQGNGTTSATVTVTGDTPDKAQNPAAALTADTLRKQLTRTGGTAYEVDECTADVADGLILPLARLNALRRAATEALDAARAAAMPNPAAGYDPTIKAALSDRPTPASQDTAEGNERIRYTARFLHPTQITPVAQAFFEILYLPLTLWCEGEKHGVLLPPVIFDRDYDRIRTRLAEALTRGARHILVGNVGHLPLIREATAESGIPAREIRLHGDFRLNVTNASTVAELLDGHHGGVLLQDTLLSPELTLPRIRDIARAHPGRTASIVYGRLPLMLLEKCVIRELYTTKADRRAPNGQAGQACRLCAKDAAVMVDRRGVSFPIVREFDHRNTVLNSLPLSMTDRADELDAACITHRHMIFTVESPADVDSVIRATREGTPLSPSAGDVRRMMSK